MKMYKKIVLLFISLTISISSALQNVSATTINPTDVAQTAEVQEMNEKDVNSDHKETESQKKEESGKTEETTVPPVEEKEINDGEGNTKDIEHAPLPTEENLANEPPVIAPIDIIQGSRLDWTILDARYWVRVAGASLDSGDMEGTWFTLNGETVFCIEAKVQAYRDQDYDLDNTFLSFQQKHDMSLITYFAFTTQEHDEKHYALAQYMIWEYMGESLTFIDAGWNTEYQTMKADVNEQIRKFRANASFNNETITLHGIGEGYAVKLTDDNNFVADCFLSEKSSNITYSKSGNSINVWANSYSASESKLDLQKVEDGYVGEPLVYRGNSGSQRVMAENVYDPGYVYLKINIDIHAPIKITKVDATSGKTVKRQGIVYDIYKADGTYVTSTTSDASGVATSSDLAYGDYYYIEKTAPTGYQVNSTPVNFKIEVDKSIKGYEYVSSTLSDQRVTGKSTLTKLDAETGNISQGDGTLNGAIYGFYAAENIMDPSNDGTIFYKKDALVSQHTIVNGTATATTEYLGKYYWKELTPSNGYLIDPAKHEVNINYTSQNVAVEVRDTTSYETVKKQAFKIIKMSSPGDGGLAPGLKGAQFTVKLESEVQRVGWDAARSYDVLTTDQDGMAISKELPYGNYRVRETVVPAEHEPIEDFFVQVKEDNREPQKWLYGIDEIYESKLAVIKLDTETGNIVHLEGMRFKIKCLTGNADYAAGEYVGYWAWNPLPHYVNEWETTADGSVMLEKLLKPATYQIEEVEGPNGYLLNHEPLQFKISEKAMHQQLGPDGSTIVTTVFFRDKSVKGQVKIDKQAEIFKGYVSEETEFGDLYKPVYETGMLANVQFEIKAKTDIVGAEGTVWYKAGQTVQTLTTDGVNITMSGYLPLGTENFNLYTLQEIATEEGYVLDDTIRTFRFDAVDDKTAIVAPTWLDENGDVIENEDVLTLYNDKQVSLEVATKEVEQSDIEDTSNAYQDVTFGAFTAEDTDLLSKDSLVGLSKVDANGAVGFGITQSGSYYMQELAVNDQYILSDTKYPFTFAYNGDKLQIIKLNDGNPIYNYLQRGSLEIIKRDAESKLPLVNVWFELATDKEFTNIIKETCTDEKGRAIFEELEKGTYYVREKYDGNHDMVIEGYVKDPTVHEVVIGEQGQIITLEIDNQPVKGKVQFTKKGETFNDVDIVEGEFGTEHHPVWKETAVLGSEFTIFAAEDITTWDGKEWFKKDQAALTLESDWDMSESAVLPVGKYYAKETKVPHGYVCDTTVYTFEIVANGLAEIQLNPFTIYNNRARVDINMTKRMEAQDVFVNENAYKDVVFGLYALEDIYDYMGNVIIENGSLIGISRINEEGHLINTWDLPIGTYYFQELATNEQYVQLSDKFEFEIAYQGQEVTEYTIDINDGETIYNLLKRGSVEILKVDTESQLPLRNVHFELATDEEFTNVIKETATGEDGKAVFEELERGTYYVREKYDGNHDMVIEGYVRNDTVYTVEINDDKQVIEIGMENQPVKGKVQFTKTGESFNDVEIVEGEFGTEHYPVWKQGALLGSELTIYAAEDIHSWDGFYNYEKDDVVTVVESDWDMNESMELPVGKYYAKETTVPHGYIEDTTIYEFEVIANGLADIQIHPIKIHNDRARVTLNFVKSIEEQITFVNPDAYKEVVFGLYAREGIYDYMGNVLIEDGALIGTSGIDEEGHLLKTYDLPNGTYYFKELATDEQYILNDKEYDFEVAYQGQDIKEYTIDINDGETIYNLLKRGSVEILKVDTESQLPLRNVHFELATDEGFTNIIKETATGEDGKAVFEELERGTYYVREKYDGTHDMVVEGYVRNDTVYTVEINDDKQVIEIGMENQPVKGKVQFTKTGESFNDVEIVEGEFGTEHHPVWKQGALLGSELTIYAAEDIHSWDGTYSYEKDDVVTVVESDWDMNESMELPVGKYYAKETTVPHGYIEDTTIYEFEVIANGLADIQIHPITIHNERAKANINLTKSLEEQETFANPEAYKDVVFGLYAREGIYDYMGNVLIEDGALIGTSGIDAEGHLLKTYDLANSTYYFKELATNEQYILNDKEYDFEVAYQGQDIKEYTIDINDGKPIENDLIRGTIEVVKYSNDQAFYSKAEQALLPGIFGERKDPEMLRNALLKDEVNYLTGVTFEVATDPEFTNIVTEGMTDLDGRLVFEELERGTYYIREKESLDFYVINDQVFEVTIDRDGQFETVSVDNNLITSYVDIKKVDFYEQDKVLPFAGFTMYADPECTEVIEKITTGTDGIAHFDDIKFGTTVYIKETSAPAGYELSDEVVIVTIDEDWVNGDKDTRVIVFPDHLLPVIATGDQTMLWVYIALTAMSGVSLLMMLRRKRSQK